jgi:hypothetical protein
MGRLCGHDRRFKRIFSKQGTLVRSCGASATLVVAPIGADGGECLPAANDEAGDYGGAKRRHSPRLRALM